MTRCRQTLAVRLLVTTALFVVTLRADDDRSQITGVGLAHLKGLTKLEELYLAGTKVTDAGLVHLKGLTKLKSFGLNNTKVTGTGLVHLKGLTKLAQLILNRSQVTDAGIAELRQALPNCEIKK